MQRGEDGGRPGRHPGRRQVAAQVGAAPTSRRPTTLPAFTLGVVNVSPMSMAAAYATPAANGIYCKPIALTKIIDDAGKSLPVPSAGCHQAIPVRVAQAVNYILQGVFTWPGATAGGPGPRQLPGGGQDRYLQRGERQRHPVRGLRRLHHQAGRLRLGVQPGLAHGQGHDDRPRAPVTAPGPATRTALARCSARTPRCRRGT